MLRDQHAGEDARRARPRRHIERVEMAADVPRRRRQQNQGGQHAPRRPYQRCAASIVTSTPPGRSMPTHRRACHSPMPNALNASAVIQICSGGFSKYFRPL